jgi:hypothetical protein
VVDGHWDAVGAPETGTNASAGGRVCRRLAAYDDVKKARRSDAVPVRAVNESAGRRINVTAEEESTFWTWVVIQVLRRSGVRVELRHSRRPRGPVRACGLPGKLFREQGVAGERARDTTVLR